MHAHEWVKVIIQVAIPYLDLVAPVSVKHVVCVLDRILQLYRFLQIVPSYRLPMSMNLVEVSASSSKALQIYGKLCINAKQIQSKRECARSK